jgi:hypothetical protein
MSYKFRIQAILRIYGACQPLSFKDTLMAKFPWTSESDYMGILASMVKEDLLAPVDECLGKYRITERGKLINQVGGWVAFLQRNNPPPIERHFTEA